MQSRDRTEIITLIVTVATKLMSLPISTQISTADNADWKDLRRWIQ